MKHSPSICSMSLGRSFAGHSLPLKLDLAARYGFKGIELFYEDLVDYSKLLSGSNAPSLAAQLSAARSVRRLCRELQLDIICLQPLMHYEALTDREAHRRKIEEAEHWMDLACELGTGLILLPSSFLPDDELGDIEMIIQDMAEIADLGLRRTHAVKFAYEALCWGSRVDTWEKSWYVVEKVNRPNFGICLDTFNIAGRIYADPAAAGGKTLNCERTLADSMSRLVGAIDVGKVFLLQVADAEYMREPLVEGHPFYQPEQQARLSWSRNARLFYGEEDHGGYLPIKSILSTIVHDLHFEGWISFEVFNRRLTDQATVVPKEMAERARVSWSKLVEDLGLEAPKPLHHTEPQQTARASL